VRRTVEEQDALYADEPWAKLAVEAGYRPYDTESAARDAFGFCAAEITRLTAEVEDWKGRAERQYDYNVELIAKFAERDAAPVSSDAARAQADDWWEQRRSDLEVLEEQARKEERTQAIEAAALALLEKAKMLRDPTMHNLPAMPGPIICKDRARQFEEAAEIIRALSPLPPGRWVRIPEEGEEREALVGKIAHILTGAVGAQCCHRTGGLGRSDGKPCDCRGTARAALHALTEGEP